MKRIILFTFVMAMFMQLNAQSTITLNINHKLGDEDFALNQVAKNNINHDFSVKRLEYYISEITLIHDGGSELFIEDLWIHVNALRETSIDLGEYDISTLEKIRFHVGVDPDHNHLDPSSFAMLHPLAPKSPSMHWGWTAGYRFVAYEGHGGPNLNQLFELHGLGDNNYFITEIELDVPVQEDTVVINLDADYTRALEDIAVGNGVIVHGDNLQAKQCIENFRDFVFSMSSITSGTIDYSEIREFDLFPNPIIDAHTALKLDLVEIGSDYDLTITTVDGRLIQSKSDVVNGQIIDFSNYSAGLYFVNLIKEGHSIITKKVILK